MNKDIINIANVLINKKATDLKNVSTDQAIENLKIFDFLGTTQKNIEEAKLLIALNSFNGAYTSGEMSVNHINGTQSNICGTVLGIVSSIGAGSDGQGNIILTPAQANWATLTVPARLSKITALTNIVLNNAAGLTLPQAFALYITRAYKTSLNGTDVSQIQSCLFNSSGGFNGTSNDIVTSGPAYAGNIGDIGTFQGGEIVPNPGNSSYDIGNDAPFGSYYFIFGMQIPATAATKTYKFKFALEYE